MLSDYRKHVTAPIDLLTSREREVSAMIAEGKTNKDIANMLKLSVYTVDAHRGAHYGEAESPQHGGVGAVCRAKRAGGLSFSTSHSGQSASDPPGNTGRQGDSDQGRPIRSPVIIHSNGAAGDSRYPKLRAAPVECFDSDETSRWRKPLIRSFRSGDTSTSRRIGDFRSGVCIGVCAFHDPSAYQIDLVAAERRCVHRHPLRFTAAPIDKGHQRTAIRIAAPDHRTQIPSRHHARVASQTQIPRRILRGQPVATAAVQSENRHHLAAKTNQRLNHADIVIPKERKS